MMKSFEYLTISIIAIVCFTTADAESSTCTAEYADIPGHTMCLEDSSKLVESGVSADDIETIVALHNKLRGEVKPDATNLVKLVWNDKIAEVAQKLANNCREVYSSHDSDRSVPSIPFGVGQNIGGGYSSWTSVVNGWYSEISKFRYGEEPSSYLGEGGWKHISHFTQMVMDTTYLVGCGYARCDPGNTQHVCNYAGPNWGHKLARPYVNGTRCSACPLSCKEGVCDCNGLICYNGGTFDINNCKCNCPKEWKEPSCEERVCNGLLCYNGGTLDINNCKCNCPKEWKEPICKEHVCPGVTCTNGRKVNLETCACECKDTIDSCSAYGDPSFLCVQYKGWAGERCSKYCSFCT